MRRQLIITGDDFGLARAVNEAVEEAHRDGVLTCTSLMIGAAAAQDAVARARRNPSLRVGLHLAVCEGRPILPANEVPNLVDPRTREFLPPVAAFARLLARPGIQSELEAEVRAQFQAFQATGLAFDHVNGHNHMQLHPCVLPIVLKVAREYGVPAMRLSYEPLWISWRAMRTRFWSRLLPWLVMRPWARYVKAKTLAAGLVTNDYLFGIYDCGSLDVRALKAFVHHLPPGVSEIHCHPAKRRCAEIDATMPLYQHEAELAALTSRSFAKALSASGVQILAGFAELATAMRGAREA